MRTRFKVGGAIALVVALAITAAASGAGARRSAGHNRHHHGCDLGSNGHGRIRHVIYIQFDNVHLRRDGTNVRVRPRADAASAQLPQAQRHGVNEPTRS